MQDIDKNFYNHTMLTLDRMQKVRNKDAYVKAKWQTRSVYIVKKSPKKEEMQSLEKNEGKKHIF